MERQEWAKGEGDRSIALERGRVAGSIGKEGTQLLLRLRCAGWGWAGP